MVTLSELFDDGIEFRKIQRFPDGRTGLAGGSIDTELTWLHSSKRSDWLPAVGDCARTSSTAACQFVRRSPARRRIELCD
ncbi:hypothetical protein [Nocardia huaxiensis]|uniref:hypothetical protein n=1 Tax=Nocardia huaxiensis TaxID=2755382 RepID=UPI003B82EBE8